MKRKLGGDFSREAVSPLLDKIVIVNDVILRNVLLKAVKNSNLKKFERQMKNVVSRYMRQEVKLAQTKNDRRGVFGDFEMN